MFLYLFYLDRQSSPLQILRHGSTHRALFYEMRVVAQGQSSRPSGEGHDDEGQSTSRCPRVYACADFEILHSVITLMFAMHRLLH